MKLNDKHRIVFAGDPATDAGKNTTPDLLGYGYIRLAYVALRQKEKGRAAMLELQTEFLA